MGGTTVKQLSTFCIIFHLHLEHMAVGVGNSDEEKSRARLRTSCRFIFWLMLCLTSLALSQGLKAISARQTNSTRNPNHHRRLH